MTISSTRKITIILKFSIVGSNAASVAVSKRAHSLPKTKTVSNAAGVDLSEGAHPLAKTKIVSRK